MGAVTRNEIEEKVSSLAAAQHGLVSCRQLADIGLSTASIGRRVASSRWVRADRGVIRLAGAPVTWESRVLAAVLAAGKGAVASHRTAAVLHGLDGFRQGDPEVTVLNGRRFRRDGVLTHQSRDLDKVVPTIVSSIPVTRVERTLLDLGQVVRLTTVQLALDDARRQRLTDWDRLLGCLVLHARRGRDGVGALRKVLESHSAELAVTDSGFERLVLVRLAEAGLPTPVLQHEVQVAGRTYRLDLAYPDRRLAIELDGSIHLRRDVWERDHIRQNDLVLAGWTVLRFTWRDYKDRQSHMIQAIRAALARP